MSWGNGGFSVNKLRLYRTLLIPRIFQNSEGDRLAHSVGSHHGARPTSGVNQFIVILYKCLESILKFTILQFNLLE